MKKTTFWLMAAILTAGTLWVYAEHDENHDGPNGPAMQEPPVLSEDFLEDLSGALKLSEAQKSKISASIKEAKPGIKAKQDQLQTLRKEMQVQMRDLNEKIRSELNNEQRERFDEWKRHAMRRRQMRMRSRPGPRDEDEGMPEPLRERKGRKEKMESDDMPPPEMWNGHGKGGRKGSEEDDD